MFKTEQEQFWVGTFGQAYRERCAVDADMLARSLPVWADVLRVLDTMPDSALELGCNVGRNLHALRALAPAMQLTGLEINPESARLVQEWGGAEVRIGSILDFEPEQQWDMVFTRGVLIHLNPEWLESVYAKMHKAAKRWIVICEYYNPTPVSIPYRGHTDRLFKRDFAGEMLDRFPDLQLRHCQFYYHRSIFPCDDMTCFVLEKKNS